jgi:biotin carboxyl carrier protein
MDRDRIREIIRLAQESPIAELCVREGDLEVRVLKARPTPEAHAPTGPGVAPQSTTLVPVDSTVVVRATKVGFFHRGKGPGAAPLVSVGDRVQPGQALGALESLRRLTDVTADVAGEVIHILVEDGSAVEYGQALLEIRSDEGADGHAAE